MLYLYSTVGYLFAHLNQERPTFEVGLSSLSDILSNYAFLKIIVYIGRGITGAMPSKYIK